MIKRMNDSYHSDVKRDAFLVVGYRDQFSSTQKELRMLGLYTSQEEARERVFEITGKTEEQCGEENLSKGKGYVAWVNIINFGSFDRLPNAGAFEKN